MTTAVPEPDDAVAASGTAGAVTPSEPADAGTASEPADEDTASEPADLLTAPEPGDVATGAGTAGGLTSSATADGLTSSATADGEPSTDGTAAAEWAASEAPADHPGAYSPFEEPPAAGGTDGRLERLAAVTADVALRLDAVADRATLDAVREHVAELTRLRRRDLDLLDKLHAENTRLRTGELAAATAPLVHGLLRLHDQMASLAAGDAESIAGILRRQLLQVLDTAATITPYVPEAGEPFDAARHLGAARVPTSDPAQDGRVTRTLKPGFARADGTVVRVAETEVHRYAPPSPTSGTQR